MESKKTPIYRKEIDGLRAIAVIAVVINHIYPNMLPSGFLGVDIFFIISGYVVTSSLLSKSYTSYKSLLSSFYAKRVKRLLPALYAVVFTFSTLSLFFISVPKDSLKTGIYSLFGASNLFLLFNNFDYFAEGSALNLFTHTWSLGVEEQFYLIFPLLLVGTGVISFHKQFERKPFLLFILFIFSLTFYIVSQNINKDLAFYFIFSRFWQLVLGALVYLYGSRFKITHHLSIPILSLLILLFLTSQEFQLYSTLLISLLTSLLLLIINNREIDFGLQSSPAVVLGMYSYSIYLWHWPMIVLFKHTIGFGSFLTVSIFFVLLAIFSLISYHFIENPLRKANWGTNLKTIKIGLLVSLFLISINWVYYKVIQDCFSLLVTIPYSNDHQSYYNDSKCIITDKMQYPDLNSPWECLVGKKKTGRTIWVYGDSYTEQLVPVFNQINNETNFSIILIAAPGCPVWLEEFHGKGNPYRCGKTFQYFLKELMNESKKGDYVFFSNSPIYFLSPEVFRKSSNQPLEKQVSSYYNAMLLALQDKFQAQGLHFSVSSIIPIVKDTFKPCQQHWSRHRTDCSFDALIHENEIQKRLKIFEQANQGIPKLDTLKPIIEKINHKANIAHFFYNPDHLSTQGALLLKDSFLNFFVDKELQENKNLKINFNLKQI